MIPEQILTFIIALYGAMLSTAVGIWELTKERRRITIYLIERVWAYSYSVIITNAGHRPITLLDVFVGFKQEAVPQVAICAKGPDFPLTITDGQTVDLMMTPIVSQYVRDSRGKVKIIVSDTEGRTYSKFKSYSYDEKYGVVQSGVQYPKETKA